MCIGMLSARCGSNTFLRLQPLCLPLYIFCDFNAVLFLALAENFKPSLILLSLGIAGGFAPPTPDAIHVITKESETTPLNIVSQVRPPGTGSVQDLAPKSLHAKDTTNSLVDELHGILKELPTEQPPGSEDIYGLNTSIMWGDDGFQWQNGGPQGCGGGSSMIQATEEQKEKFKRAVAIVDELVGTGE
jgi:hypothetical protein